MSTRCLVGLLDNTPADPVIRYVYLHSDGYPDWTGRVLSTAFTCTEAVKKLVELGDLSCLDRTGEATAYHRDRGEPYSPPRTVAPAKLLDAMKEYDAEFAYVWDDAKATTPSWRICSLEEPMQSLADLLKDRKNPYGI